MPGAGDDPFVRALDELRAALASLNSARLSYRKIANKLSDANRAATDKSAAPTLSRETISNVLKCESVPTADSLAIVVRQLARSAALNDRAADKDKAAHQERAQVERFEALRRKALAAKAARQDETAPAAAPDITVHAAKWVRHLDENRTGTTAAMLLAAEADAGDTDEAGAAGKAGAAASATDALAVLGDLRRLLDLRYVVEVVPLYDGVPVRVKDLSQLWVVLLVDLVLHADRPGDRKWLARQTGTILGDGVPAGVQRLRAVWRRLFDGYLSVDGRLCADFLRQAVIAPAATPGTADEKASRLLTVVRFLRDVVDAGPDTAAREDARKVISRALGEYSPTSGADRLAKTARLLIHAGEAGPSLRSPASSLRQRLGMADGIRVGGYTFEAMRYPLTNEQAVHIFELPGDLRKPHHPYLVNSDRRDPIRIRHACEELDPDPRWVWDIPTSAEWIALAGCEDQPFPWGVEPPSDELANLTFNGGGRSTEPVDRRPQGGSPYGTFDCCGNVHELVSDVHVGGAYPRYLLAGGSFRTLARFARCRRVKPLLITGDRVTRANVGLRLVRFGSAEANATIRRADGSRLMAGLTQGTGVRTLRSLLASLAYLFPPGGDPVHDAVVQAVHDSLRDGARQVAVARLVRHLLTTGRKVPRKSHHRIRALLSALGVTEFTATELDRLLGEGRSRGPRHEQVGYGIMDGC